jgi:hypothetical protein
MKQIKVGLPDATRDYLEERAQSNGRSLSEEVRARIDQSVIDDRYDKYTQELGRDIMRLAHMNAESTKWDESGSSWSKDLKQLEALRVAVDAWLAIVASELNLKPSEGSKFDPTTLGKSTASAYAHLKPMLIKHRRGGDNMEEEK